MKNLIIVESPAKARTIKNFLGKEYEVIASKGHIRDLPKSRFGIKVGENNILTPEYSVAKENAPTVKKIRDLAKKATLSPTVVQEIRSGKKSNPTINSIRHIFTSLGYEIILKRKKHEYVIS